MTHRNVHLSLVLSLGLFALLCVSPQVAARPTKGKDSAATLSRKIKKAKAQTNQPTAQANVISELLRHANATQDPARLTFLYTAAFEIGILAAENRLAAMLALDTLARRVPAQRAAVIAKTLPLAQRAFREETGPMKPIAARRLIRRLQAAAEQKIRALAPQAAQALLAEAMTIAKSHDKKSLPALQRQLKALPARLAIRQKQKSLEQTLAKNPDDKGSREALIYLCLLELDDPDQASVYVRSDLNELLRSYVPLATRDPRTLPHEVAGELASWIDVLIARVDTPKQQLPLLLRQRDYISLFLKGYQKQDLRRTKATLQLKRINATLQAAGLMKTRKYWCLDSNALGLIATPAVNASIQKAQRFLLSAQGRRSKTWRTNKKGLPSVWSDQATTALVLLALIESGVSPDDPRIAAGLQALDKTPADTDDILLLAMRIGVWAACETPLAGYYHSRLVADATRLAKSTSDGSFVAQASPSKPARNGTPYFTSLAVYALMQAGDLDVPLPNALPLKLLTWWRRSQSRDGSWAIDLRDGSNQHGTASGALNLLMILNLMGRSRPQALLYSNTKTALVWLDKHARVEDITAPIPYFWTLSRLGVARGATTFKKVNWFKTATASLLKHQSKTGAWNPNRTSATLNTAMALLTLSTAQIGR